MRGGSQALKRNRANPTESTAVVNYSGKNSGGDDPRRPVLDANGDLHMTAAEVKACVCIYCAREGHLAQFCFKLIRDMKKKAESSASAPPPPSAPQATVGSTKGKKDKKKKASKKRKAEEVAANLAHVQYGMLMTLPVYSVTETATRKGVTPESIILDTGANINVVNDLSMLTDVNEVTAVSVKGVAKSRVKANKVGTFGDFGLAYFIPSSPYNIVLFRLLKRKFKVNYDQDVRDAFICYTSNKMKQHVFAYKEETGLYHLSARKELTSTVAAPAAAVFTPEQISRMDGVELLHNALHHPGDDVLGDGLDAGAYLHCPYTRQDLKNLRAFRGGCIHCMAGKTTAEPVSDQSMSPPPPYMGHTLHQDIVFVSKSPYLLTTEGLFGYCTVIPLKSKHTQHVVEATKTVIAHFASKDKKVQVIRSDNEAVFRACIVALNKEGVDVQFSSPGTHESRIERVVRVVRERIRAELSALHNMYKLPPALYPYLFTDIVNVGNLMPNKKTRGTTPRQLLTGEKIAMADIGAPFGTVAAFRNPNIPPGDKTAPRVDLGIVVGRDLSTKGSVRVLPIGEQGSCHS